MFLNIYIFFTFICLIVHVCKYKLLCWKENDSLLRVFVTNTHLKDIFWCLSMLQQSVERRLSSSSPQQRCCIIIQRFWLKLQPAATPIIYNNIYYILTFVNIIQSACPFEPMSALLLMLNKEDKRRERRILKFDPVVFFLFGCNWTLSGGCSSLLVIFNTVREPTVFSPTVFVHVNVFYPLFRFKKKRVSQ